MKTITILDKSLNNEAATVTLLEDTKNPRTAIVCNLLSHPAFRRMGYGSIAIHQAEKEAFLMGFQRVRLQCNPLSWKRRWYARMGYKPLAVTAPVMFKTPFYIWMEKAI